MTKPPIQVLGGRPGKLASCSDPATWAYHSEAQTARASGRLDGIGLQLLNLKGFAAIDLDDVRNPSTGELLPWARHLVADCGSYAEVTPSGEGVRILGTVASDYPPNHRKLAHSDGGSFEIYANTITGRFITITGDRLADSPDLLAPIDTQIGRLPAAACAASSTAPGAQPAAVNGLSARLLRLIETGATADRSADFQSAVNGLLRAGVSQAEALAIFRRHPNGPAGKYAGRLETELARSWSKAEQYAGATQRLTNRPETTCTEDMVATVLADRFGDDLRFDHDARCWMVWSGDYWQRDDENRVLQRCREIARELSAVVEPGRRDSAGRASFAAGAERLARTDPVFSARRSEWDPDPLSLGVPGGVVDLRTGELGPPDREDRISRRTTVAPDMTMTCNRWLEFLREAAGPEPELPGYLQRLAGYCLTGSTTEQTLAIVLGPAACGKSTFVSTLVRILGDYAMGAAHMPGRPTGARSIEVAGLNGRRLVHAVDVRSLSGPVISQLTSTDPITVCSPRLDDFTFQPLFKTMATAARLPALSTVDPAVRRRLHVIPFLGQPAKADPELGRKLQVEGPAILAWAIRGCLAWQKQGLSPPAVVTKASHDYLATRDLTGRWIERYCLTGEEAGLWTPIADLYASWASFCKSVTHEHGSEKAFALELKRRGFRGDRRRVDGRQLRGRAGIGLRNAGERP